MQKYKVKTEKQTIKQRGGESPNIHVTRRIYIPISKRLMPKGISREQFHDILGKASEPKGKE